MARLVRFQAVDATPRGAFPGVFALANGLSADQRLSPDDEKLRQSWNAWFERSLTDPGRVDGLVYDRSVHPLTEAWFKTAAASEFIERAAAYGELLSRYGVAWRRLEDDDPGRVIYEDCHQVVVVPHRSP